MGTEDRPWEPPPERPGGVWRNRIQRSKTLKQTPGNVVVRVPSQFQDSPLLAGLSPARVLPEGDAEYVIPVVMWREIIKEIRKIQEKQSGESR